MNLTETVDKDALDRALVACLRLFARRGRELRMQKQIANLQPAPNKTMSESTHPAFEIPKQNPSLPIK